MMVMVMKCLLVFTSNLHNQLTWRNERYVHERFEERDRDIRSSRTQTFSVSLNTPLILGIGRGPHLTPLGKKGYSYKTNSPNKIAMKSGEIN